MSEHKEYLQERDRMDFLTQKGFKIVNVTENLSGAFVDFAKKEDSLLEKETLQIVTPEGRKYFTVILIKQQKESNMY